MRPLIAKDLRLLAPYAWIIAPAHLLWCVQATLAAEYYFWMSLAAALAWTVAVATIEWRLDTDRLVASFPVTRAAIVYARFAGAFGVLAVAAALYVVYGRAVMAVAGDRFVSRWPGTPAWAGADGVLAFLAAGAALLVVFLPLLYRFGLPVASAVGGLVAGVAIIAISASAADPAGAHAVATTPGSGLSGADGVLQARLPAEVIRGWMRAMVEAWGAVPASLAVVGSISAAAGLSARLSARIFEGRDL